MTIDYADLVDVANELIGEAGRKVQFLRYNRVKQDENKPWLGSPDITNTIDEETDAVAVFVDPSSLRHLGIESTDEDLVKRINKIAIVAPGTEEADFRKYDAIRDEDTIWRIVNLETLKPGDTIVCYFAGVAK